MVRVWLFLKIYFLTANLIMKRNKKRTTLFAHMRYNICDFMPHQSINTANGI